MLITVRVGEYLYSVAGTHILDAEGFATRATVETTVEVTDADKIALITAYQTDVRAPAP